MNVKHAYHDLQHAVESLSYATLAVADAVARAQDRSGGSHFSAPAVPYENAARQSSLAAEFACKAALALRGAEPRRSHSVNELCSVLAGRDPLDPLLAVLVPLDGGTKEAHGSFYHDSQYPGPYARAWRGPPARWTRSRPS